MSSLYIELCPKEFRERIKECPVAYLPLGTLEWHGPHNPLGADGIQSEGFFERFANEYGGIVLPKLFLGPDRKKIVDGIEYYGIDYSNNDDPVIAYDDCQLSGSAYYVDDELFEMILMNIAKQLVRAGFKILVAHGHGPSTFAFKRLKDKFKDTYGLDTLTLFDLDIEDELKFQNDHAAANETSIMMALRKDLVHMEYNDEEVMKAVYGKDPRIFASEKLGNEIIDINIKYLKEALDTMRKQYEKKS